MDTKHLGSRSAQHCLPWPEAIFQCGCDESRLESVVNIGSCIRVSRLWCAPHTTISQQILPRCIRMSKPMWSGLTNIGKTFRSPKVRYGGGPHQRAIAWDYQSEPSASVHLFGTSQTPHLRVRLHSPQHIKGVFSFRSRLIYDQSTDNFRTASPVLPISYYRHKSKWRILKSYTSIFSKLICLTPVASTTCQAEELIRVTTLYLSVLLLIIGSKARVRVLYLV